ncbi:oligopeptide/dipeptide ABC transporter ATP-binding protein [Aestuariivirga sp.]|jgi:oligopeptide/dipeptide ABC transporter ATP-binding protein|uniref:oligopeptide/dipeptide ABC transporter ATP-binding protein n=1 Tax=Aestuariivirga sp. TaxID=2650926 RepID=UPI003784A48C
MPVSGEPVMPVAVRVTGLSKRYQASGGFLLSPRAVVHALQPLSLDVAQGETLGIVGESGCGKSTLARMLAGLLAPSSGHIEFHGKPLNAIASRKLGMTVQYVFQDPLSSLNPRKTIRQVLEAPLRFLHCLEDAAISARIAGLLNSVNLDQGVLTRYPHEFSGGQAQRIVIARALAADPQVLVLDEPVSALDVSVQAQVLNLLSSLKSRMDLTYLFISHDLAVIEAVSDRIAVLYFGHLVELGLSRAVLARPLHPYTKLLSDSAPKSGRRIPSARADELPDPLNPPPGCPFSRRCPSATDLCHRKMPIIRELEKDRAVACHHPLIH